MWKYKIISPMLLVVVALAGCAEDDQLPTIRGSLDIQFDEGRTGFDFEGPVPLAGDPSNVSPGCAAGGCRLTYDPDGHLSSFELWIDRGTDGVVGAGFRGFDLTVTESEVSVVASVFASDGERSYASAGSAACTVTPLDELGDELSLDVEVDCAVESLEGDQARVTASLALEGCTEVWEQ